MSIVPAGFQTVSPYILCDDPNALAQWLIVAFDAQEIGRTEVEGRIANLQMQLGTVTLMMSQSDDRYSARPAAFYIYVANADDSMQRAIEAGASLEMQVMDMPYGDRQGGVVDPAGNIWWVSQRLSEEPYQPQ